MRTQGLPRADLMRRGVPVVRGRVTGQASLVEVTLPPSMGSGSGASCDVGKVCNLCRVSNLFE